MGGYTKRFKDGTLALIITDEGFELRDVVRGCWLIDASCIEVDGKARINRTPAIEFIDVNDFREKNPMGIIRQLKEKLRISENEVKDIRAAAELYRAKLAECGKLAGLS